jgi:photosystem II stability/assembly factor-like uncharacterized protein
MVIDLRRLVFSLLILVLLAAPVTAQGPDETILFEEHFDSPAQWELQEGWQFVQDGDNAVLSGEGHYWASPGPAQSYPGDFRLTFRLKLLRGRVHLVYRTNNTGRYFIGFHANGSDLHKQYWPDTFMHGLVQTRISHSLGTWYDIEIVGQGDTLSFFVNGNREWAYIDPDPLLYGSFAFETLDDSLAYVDDIVVYGPASAAPTPATVSQSWVRTGGPLGGLGYDIRMRPDNPDIMYVTDAWAGVFMSEDGGQTWHPANDGITTRTGESSDAIPVFCLTIDPHDYDTVWIGTQNVRGIFKSTDGGQTWVKKDNGVIENFGITFRGFTVDPRSSDIVYAAAELSSWVWAGEGRPGREFDMVQGVVYKTTDGGENWTPIWRGQNLARYVWIDPRDPDVIYISTGIFDREAANSVPASRVPGSEGVVKSTDGGQTWTNVNNGLDNLYVGTLFMHPKDPDVLLAGVGNNQYPDGSGVYITTDGGAAWQQTLVSDNINSVEVAPSDPDIAYAGSASAVYRSTDGGWTWTQVSGGPHGWGSPGVRAGFPIDFQVDPRDPNRIFANNYGGGNFVSNDGGRTWQIASSGYTGAQMRDITVDPSGRVYAAGRSGIFTTTDGGDTWTGLNTPPARSMEWYVVAIDPSDSQHLLAANNWNGILLQSFDQGRQWQPVGPQGQEMQSWRAIAFAPSDPMVVYAGKSTYYSAGTFADDLSANGIYVSYDGGTRWAAANDALSQNANVTGLAVAPNDPQIVYAATGNKGLLKTDDGGQSWSALNLGTPGGSPVVLSVRVHPTDPSHIYAGLREGGLYQSTDAGATWQLASIGMNPEASVSDIVLDPTNPQVMYATDLFSGVYRSDDGGQSWFAMNEDLRMRAVNALALTNDSAHLYAATEGEGVFRLDLNGTPPQ